MVKPGTDPRHTARWRKLAKARVAVGASYEEPCAWCHKPINYGLHGEPKPHWNSRMAPTVDHIDGMAADPYPALERLAVLHRGCNTAKSNRGVGEGSRGAGRKRAAPTPKRAPSRNERLGFRAPAGMAPPHYLTTPPPGSASLADEWIPWVTEHRGIRLRPWQAVAARVALTLDSAGALMYRRGVISTSRQSGKGVWIEAFAPARCAHAARFGEVQDVIHAAMNLGAARRMHEASWRWAAEHGVTVKRAYGNERMIWPDGSHWSLSSMPAIYGASGSFLLLDESWDITWEDVQNGAMPILVERAQSQMLLLSTANPAATMLTPRYRRDAIERRDPRMFIAEWSASPDDDPLDPMTWWAASASWSAARHELMATAAAADLDLFRYQWLNIWPGLPGERVHEWPPGWGKAPKAGPGSAGGIGAVEASRDRAWWGVAYAARDGDTVTVTAARVADLSAAHEWMAGHGPEEVLVGLTHVEDWNSVGGWLTTGVGSRETYEATPWLASMVSDGLVAHEHGELLADQVAAARIAETERGQLLSAKRSEGGIETLKAVAWAVNAARTQENVTVRIF